MLAAKYASRLLQLHIIPFTLPISLNSLDREGVRLLSDRGEGPDVSMRWWLSFSVGVDLDDPTTNMRDVRLSNR